MERGMELRNRPRGRQRMSRKMLFILGSSIICLVIAFVTVLNLSNVDTLQAAIKSQTSATVNMIPEQVYPTAVTLDQTPSARSLPADMNAQLGHVAKPLPKTE